MFFKYPIRDLTGVTIEGTIRTLNEQDAAKKLQEHDLFVISVEMAGIEQPEIMREKVPNIPEGEKQGGTTKKCPYCAEE